VGMAYTGKSKKCTKNTMALTALLDAAGRLKEK